MIISGSFLKIENNKDLVKKFASSVSNIHFDVMDGIFTERATLSPKLIDFGGNLKPIDVHLMVVDVKKYVDDVLVFNPEFISFHIEVGNTLEYINYIKDKGCKVGLAINPFTDLSLIYPFLSIIDLVLVMSVPAGAGGQKFIDVSERIDILFKYRNNNLKYLICVDGGINSNTIHKVLKADMCVVGSFITDGDFNERFNIIKGEVE